MELYFCYHKKSDDPFYKLNMSGKGEPKWFSFLKIHIFNQNSRMINNSKLCLGSK